MDRELRDSIRAFSNRPWAMAAAASDEADDARYRRSTSVQWIATAASAAAWLCANGAHAADARREDLDSHLAQIRRFDAIREFAATPVR